MERWRGAKPTNTSMSCEQSVFTYQAQGNDYRRSADGFF